MTPHRASSEGGGATRAANWRSPGGDGQGPPRQPPILEFCNAPLELESWHRRCLQLLHQEGILPSLPARHEQEATRRFHFKGMKVTFGNVEFLHGRIREILIAIAEKGQFTPRHIEALNTALGERAGLRFRLERIPPDGKNETERLSLAPKTFDLSILLQFVAARFLSGLDPRRLKLCPHCGTLFFLEAMRRRRFCSDGCRFRYHNRERVRTGEQARYMRKRRAEKK